VLLLGLSLFIGTPADARARHRARPILTGHAFGDPSVVAVGRDKMMVATGPRVLRASLGHGAHHWRWRKQALVGMPRWARHRGGVWAPDVARIGRRWVLYFAAPVRGLGGSARCIGVATSRTAYGPFRPSDRRPLVCQKGARTPRAYDMAAAHGLRHRGVIDPSYFRDRSGRSYLLYKTAGQPSSIRILPLAHGGLARRPHTRSHELVRSRGTVENPTMIRKGRRYFLFTSEDSWATCDYRETWRVSSRLRSWPAYGHRLLTQRSTHGLCGPGGADVVGSGRRTAVYFHGWVGRRSTAPVRSHHDVGDGARRALYAARLRWRHHRPVVWGWVRR
jgi:beta-xylosidase